MQSFGELNILIKNFIFLIAKICLNMGTLTILQALWLLSQTLSTSNCFMIRNRNFIKSFIIHLTEPGFYSIKLQCIGFKQIIHNISINKFEIVIQGIKLFKKCFSNSILNFCNWQSSDKNSTDLPVIHESIIRNLILSYQYLC